MIDQKKRGKLLNYSVGKLWSKKCVKREKSFINNSIQLPRKKSKSNFGTLLLIMQCI